MRPLARVPRVPRVPRALVGFSALSLLITGTCVPGTAFAGGAGSGPFATRVVTTGLENPWEIVEGPDGFLWVTEKTGKRVTRVDVTDGSKSTAITIDEVLSTEGKQDGLLGMALHPELLRGTGNDHVYLLYTYDADPGDVQDRRTKVRRYTFDAATGTLHSPKDLLTGLPGGDDHESGRLVFGPDAMLYLTIGDLGANQYEHVCDPNQAQRVPGAAEVAQGDWSAYQGKVLRIGLEGSIPQGNPVIDGVRSHVFSYGHRNAQGLAFSPEGLLYATEHGPKSDDEINRIRAGGNYGWPNVLGHRDDMAYEWADWSTSEHPSCPALTYDDYEIPPSVPREQETDWSSPAFVPPLATMYTVPTGYDFRDPRCAAPEFTNICWPNIAPSSAEYYASDAIPGWKNSLLVPTLKDGTLHRAVLNADGTAVEDLIPYFKSVNRYRDTAIADDGRTVFIATDSAGSARDMSGAPTTGLEDPGAILAFTYTRE